MNCPIDLIPPLGYTGPASCKLYIPYVCFFMYKNPVGDTWEMESEGEEGRETQKTRAEWNAGSVSLLGKEHSCESPKFLVCHNFSGDLTSLFIHWSMLLVRNWPTSSQD